MRRLTSYKEGRKARREISKAVLGAFALLAMAGCHGAVVLSDGAGLACAGDTSAAGLAGSWVVVGSGTRSGCSDARYEGAFTLGPSKPIAVAVKAADAGSGNLSDLEAVSPPPGFAFDGAAQSSCVNFTTSETANGHTTVYTFSGTLQGANVVTGTLSGTGPGTCVVTGSFSVSAQ
jgi:hypothetical protein